jgi:hypothetical protein
MKHSIKSTQLTHVNLTRTAVQSTRPPAPLNMNGIKTRHLRQNFFWYYINNYEKRDALGSIFFISSRWLYFPEIQISSQFIVTGHKISWHPLVLGSLVRVPLEAWIYNLLPLCCYCSVWVLNFLPLNNPVFYGIPRCSPLEVDRNFGRTYRFNVQGFRTSQRGKEMNADVLPTVYGIGKTENEAKAQHKGCRA